MTTKGDNTVHIDDRATGLREASSLMDQVVDLVDRIGYRRLAEFKNLAHWLRSDAEAADDFMAIFDGSRPAKIKEQKNPKKKVAARTPVGQRQLARRSEFGSMTTIAAIVQLLEAAAAPIANDELARKIFVVENNHDLKRALKSLSSALSTGCAKKLFRSLGDGKYEAMRDE
jgi:hypothetical protein